MFTIRSGKTAPRFLARALRIAGFFGPMVFGLLATAQSAVAQNIDIIRDAEIERVMRQYEDPLLKAAGLDPHSVKLYLVNDPEINAFATQSPVPGESESIFVNTGTFLQLKTPNQLIGILAHETGHIAGGHIVRDASAIRKSAVPMLLGIALGVAAIAMGAGEAAMGAIALGGQAAQAQFFQFSRAQEATADQMGQRYLKATHQSGRGMLEVFNKFAGMEAEITYGRNTPLITDHPLSRERIDLLQQLVEASPYKETKDSPAALHEFQLIQAKLAGFLNRVDTVLTRYPPSDQSAEGHYARAVAYFRKPDMKKAIEEANTLVKLEPNNPFYWEILGQIYVEMSQPQNGILPYQKSVDLAPDEPLLRLSLAAAQIATGKAQFAKPALDNLKIVLHQENNNSFAWYEAAQAYSDAGNEGMANLSTAELKYNVGNFKEAVHFATIAQHKLAAGSTDWQRAQDILAISKANADSRR
ncbi:MAG: M48 family metallopeptidase [Alphaproteobacteria bacterium]|nr:M48 family metallopeptidase [Alphaproteobacteria bacterium]